MFVSESSVKIFHGSIEIPLKFGHKKVIKKNSNKKKETKATYNKHIK